LTYKLLDELPGIFNWAVEGLRRLRSQGRFSEAPVCEGALDAYQAENNPARAFLREQYFAAPEAAVTCEDLYRAYFAWTRAAGHVPLTKDQFGKELRRAFPNVERRRNSGPEREYVYEGIARLP
jgi:putative DNA primase/helicase